MTPLLFLFTSPSEAANFTIAGKLEFVANFPTLQRIGQVPNGKAPLPHLYVCAWDKDDTVDFEFTDYPGPGVDPGNNDDELLGCDRADVAGNYSISASFNTVAEPQPDLYLVTHLCDDDHQGAFSPADVCVRVNAPEGDVDEPQNAKAIWSKSYPDTPASGTVTLSWNLSCPNQDGKNLASVTCATVDAPDWSERSPLDAVVNTCACDNLPWKDCLTKTSSCATPGTCGDTNSRYGCNVEALLVYRAAIEPYVTWGTNKPDDSNTFSKDCEAGGAFQVVDDVYDLGGDDHCEASGCQDEVNFHLANVQAVAGQSFDGTCPAVFNNLNGAGDFDKVCIRTPTLPFRVIHEFGHVIQNRWLCDDKDARSRDPAVAPFLPVDPNEDSNKSTREGWANFVASRAWSADRFCGTLNCYEVEALTTFEQEELVSRVFWDLSDSIDDGIDDSEDWTFQEIRNIWSAFPFGWGASATREVDPGPFMGNGEQASGVNMIDYAYWWADKRGSPLSSSFCDIYTWNLVAPLFHSDSLPSGDFDDLCP